MIMTKRILRGIAVLTVLFLFLVNFAEIPVKAGGPYVHFDTYRFFVKGGETLKLQYDANGTVTFDKPVILDYTGETDKIFTMSGDVVKAASDENYGYGKVDVYLNGSYEVTIFIYVYAEPEHMYEIYDFGRVFSDGDFVMNLEMEPAGAQFAPIHVYSDNTNIAYAEDDVMPARWIKICVNDIGHARFTMSANGSVEQSFALSVLENGDYAEMVMYKGEAEQYLPKGYTLDLNKLFEMSSDNGTCKDDELTFYIENQDEFVPAVADLGNGKIKGVHGGEVFIRAASKLGFYDTCWVYVYTVPEKITFPEKKYYFYQDDTWLAYPIPEIEPEEARFAPLVYESSDTKIIRTDGSLQNTDIFRYVKAGDAVITAKFRDNESIRGSFKVKTFNADYAKDIKVASSAVLYEDFSKELPVTFDPFLSIHTIDEIADSNEGIVFAEYSGDPDSLLHLEGLKAGKTTLTLKSGPSLKKKIDVTVRPGRPEPKFVCQIGEIKNDGDWKDSPVENAAEYTFVLGKTYMIDAWVEWEDEHLVYIGSEYLLPNDFTAILEGTKLFKTGLRLWAVDDQNIRFEAIKTGTATVELYSGKKIKLTVKTPAEMEPVQMLRLYNPNSGEHFYTAKAAEKNALVTYGWKYEGVGWYAPKTSSIPVYRLYNSHSGDHHYTMKKAEKDALVSYGWKYEGIGWYSDPAKGVPLYREYNPNMPACNHNYTRKKAEHDYLVDHGWKDEGIGWYGVNIE